MNLGGAYLDSMCPFLLKMLANEAYFCGIVKQ